MEAVRWREIAVVFQGAMNALNPVLTVRDQVLEPIRLHEPATGGRAARARVDELFEQVGIPARRGREYPHEFSGGMRQRIMIAIALACRPMVILCDEPTTALDVTIQDQILKLLVNLCRDFGVSLVFVNGLVTPSASEPLAVVIGLTLGARPWRRRAIRSTAS